MKFLFFRLSKDVLYYKIEDKVSEKSAKFKQWFLFFWSQVTPEQQKKIDNVMMSLS